MQLALGVQILKAAQQFAYDDSDVLFLNFASLHLISMDLAKIVQIWVSVFFFPLTKSLHDPPEQYSITIHNALSFRYEPWYLIILHT